VVDENTEFSFFLNCIGVVFKRPGKNLQFVHEVLQLAKMRFDLTTDKVVQLNGHQTHSDNVCINFTLG
jgi:hypothetical protein